MTDDGGQYLYNHGDMVHTYNLLRCHGKTLLRNMVDLGMLWQRGYILPANHHLQNATKL